MTDETVVRKALELLCAEAGPLPADADLNAAFSVGTEGLALARTLHPGIEDPVFHLFPSFASVSEGRGALAVIHIVAPGIDDPYSDVQEPFPSLEHEDALDLLARPDHSMGARWLIVTDGALWALRFHDHTSVSGFFTLNLDTMMECTRNVCSGTEDASLVALRFASARVMNTLFRHQYLFHTGNWMNGENGARWELAAHRVSKIHTSSVHHDAWIVPLMWFTAFFNVCVFEETGPPSCGAIDRATYVETVHRELAEPASNGISKIDECLSFSCSALASMFGGVLRIRVGGPLDMGQLQRTATDLMLRCVVVLTAESDEAPQRPPRVPCTCATVSGYTGFIAHECMSLRDLVMLCSGARIDGVVLPAIETDHFLFVQLHAILTQRMRKMKRLMLYEGEVLCDDLGPISFGRALDLLVTGGGNSGHMAPFLVHIARTTGKYVGLIDYRMFDTNRMAEIFQTLLDITIDEAPLPAFVKIKTERKKNGVGSDRKKYGAFYTSMEIVSFMTKRALARHIEDMRAATTWFDFNCSVLRINVLDPTMGSGRFLLCVLREIVAEIRVLRWKFPERPSGDFRDLYATIVDHGLFGMDLNPTALDVARFALRFELSRIAPGRPTPGLSWNLVYGDSIRGCFSPVDILKDTRLTGAVRSAIVGIYRGGGGEGHDFLDLCKVFDPEFSRVDSDMLSWRNSKLFQELFRAAERVAGSSAKPNVGTTVSRCGWGGTFEDGIHWFLAFPRRFIENSGLFSVVLTNPPWLQMKNTTGMLPIPDLYPTIRGHVNLYVPVLHRALHSLGPDGELGAIVPQSILNEDHKKEDRNQLMDMLTEINVFPFSEHRGKLVFRDPNQVFAIILGKRWERPSSVDVVLDFRTSIRTPITMHAFPVPEDMMRGPVRHVKRSEIEHRGVIPIGAGLEDTLAGFYGPEGVAWGKVLEFRAGSQAWQHGKMLDLVKVPDAKHTMEFVSPKLIDPFSLARIAAKDNECPKDHGSGTWWINPTPEPGSRQGFSCNSKSHTTTATPLRPLPMPDGGFASERVIWRGMTPNARGITGLSKQQGIACVVGKYQAGNNNVRSAWLKDPPSEGGAAAASASVGHSVPRDIYFYAAVINTFFCSLAMREERVQGTLTVGFVSKMYLPMMETPTEPAIVPIMDDVRHLGALVVGVDLLVPQDALFASELPMSNGTTVTVRRDTVLVGLIGLTARWFELEAPRRTLSRAKKNCEPIKSLRWDDDSGPTRVPQILLHHLVARWYGIDAEGYRRCADRQRMYTQWEDTTGAYDEPPTNTEATGAAGAAAAASSHGTKRQRESSPPPPPSPTHAAEAAQGSAPPELGPRDHPDKYHRPS